MKRIRSSLLLTAAMLFVTALNVSFSQAQYSDKNIAMNSSGPSPQTVQSATASNYWVMPYVQMGQSFGTQPAKWPWGSVTHVVLFGITPTASSPYYSTNPGGFANIQQIVTLAHSYNPPKKVIVSFDNSSNGGYPNISGITNAALRAGLVHQLAVWARSLGTGGKTGIDGFGFDFEGGEGGTQAIWDGVYQAFRDTLSGPNFVCSDGAHGLLIGYTALSVSFPYNSATTKACFDKYAIQGYDMNTSSAGYSFVGMAPLEGPYGCGGTTINGQNDSAVVFNYINAGIPKSQLILGMNFYGRSYYTTTQTTNPDFCTPWTGVRSNFLTYDQIVNTELTTPGVVRKYNPVTGVTILANGSSNKSYITEYPDSFYVKARAQFVQRQGLGGMFNYDLAWAHLTTVPAGHRADELQEWMSQMLGSGGGTSSDLIAPTVSLTGPVNGSQVLGTVNISATASDNVGVTKVEFYLNGILLGSKTSAPYTYLWNVAALLGSQSLSAKAYDAAGNVGVSTSVTVTVTTAPPPADTVKPVVSITSPLNGATVSGSVVISSTASDNVGVAKVEFYLNGSLLGSKASAPYTYTWNTAGLSGSQSLSAKAYDAAGNIGTSALVAVTMATAPPPPDTVKPVVSISSPLNGTTVSGSVVISSTASDNVGVAKVEFYLNGSLLGSTVSSPYSYSWNTAGLSGSQSLSAKAYDAAGNIGTSAPVSAVIQATTSGTDQWLYQDAMSSSWVDVSWSSVNTFASTGHVYAGSYSLKAVQTSWGGVSLHSGTYVSPINISPGLYSKFEFAVYNTTAQLALKIYLENDQGQTFTAVTQNNVPVNQWTIISIPMAQLNPSNFNINRINIQNFTALTTTYYLDNVRFVGINTPDVTPPTVAIMGRSMAHRFQGW